jgi:hypothetical protein
MPHCKNLTDRQNIDKKNKRMPTLREIKRGASPHTKPTLLHHI